MMTMNFTQGDQNRAKHASGGNAGNNHDITPQSGGTGTPGWGFYVSITRDEHKICGCEGEVSLTVPKDSNDAAGATKSN